MIIEGDVHEDIGIIERGKHSMHIEQQGDIVVIDKQQAAQLVEVLQKWLDGEGGSGVMANYFIHAEVLSGGNLITKASGIATTTDAVEAFNWFMDSDVIANYKVIGFDVIIDKIERVE